MNLLAFMCSNLPQTQWDTREIAVTLPYGAVLAGRMLPKALAKRALRPGLVTWAACYLFALIFALTCPGRPANDQNLVTWLSRRGVHHHDLAGQPLGPPPQAISADQLPLDGGQLTGSARPGSC